jgi:hypothetical protein
MNSYFFPISNEERENILNKHKHVYNGYRTLNPNPVENEQPLYVQDFANDKEGLVVNNKGEVKAYTNMGINEARKRKPYLADEEMKEGEVDEFFKFDFSDEDVKKEKEKKQKRQDELDSALSSIDKKEVDKKEVDKKEVDENEPMCEECGGDYMEETEFDKNEMEEIEHHDLKKGSSYKMKIPNFDDDNDEEGEFEYTGPVNYEFGEPHHSFQRKDRTGGALLGKDLSRLYTEDEDEEIEVSSIEELGDAIFNSGRLEEILSMLDMDEYSDEYDFVDNVISELTWEYTEDDVYDELQEYLKVVHGEKLFEMFERYLEGDEDWMIDTEELDYSDELNGDEFDNDEIEILPDNIDEDVDELDEDGTNVFSTEFDSPVGRSAYGFMSGGPEQFSDDENEPQDGYQDDIENIQNMFDYASQHDSDSESRDMIKNLNKQMNTDFDGDEPSDNETPAYNFVSGGPPGVTFREGDEELDEEEVEEKWSEKYKKSIDCSNPKGFSQKAHCQGKKKDTNVDEEVGDDLKENFSKQRKLTLEMFERFNKYN